MLLHSEANVLTNSAAGELHARVCKARLDVIGTAKMLMRELYDEIDLVVSACDEGGLVAPPSEESSLDASLRRLESLLGTLSRASRSLLNSDQHAQCDTATCHHLSALPCAV